MHIYVLHWSAVNIAGFNVDATPIDQFFMLGTFGISTFLTRSIYLLISKRAPQLSPYILGLIPGSYLLGLTGIWSNGICGTSQYAKQYLLHIYIGICIATLDTFLV